VAEKAERWTITVDKDDRPVALELGVEALDCHSGWREVEVVPAQVAERLADASQAYIDAVRAYNAEGSKDAATRQSHTYQDLREAILAFRSGSSKEGHR
jgi:hypothetical protein